MGIATTMLARLLNCVAVTFGWNRKEEITMALDTAELVAARDELATEVGETAAQFAKDAEKLAALEAELASVPAAQATVNEVAASLRAGSQSLNDLQEKIAPPPDDVPPVETTPSARGSRGR